MEELLDYTHLVKNHKGEYLLDSPTKVQGIYVWGMYFIIMMLIQMW
jgi:hypothetical protein